MFQVRFHGRGGQGVVTGAELLSVAAFLEGRFAQAFPSFGSERMGAPVVSFCRIDDAQIRTREPVVDADAIIIQDPTLLHSVDVFQGIKPESYVLLNSGKSLADLGLADLESRLWPRRACSVPATEVASKHLGRPLPNAALLGGFAALTGAVTLESITHAILERFVGESGEANAAAAREAFAQVAEVGRC